MLSPARTSRTFRFSDVLLIKLRIVGNGSTPTSRKTLHPDLRYRFNYFMAPR